MIDASGLIEGFLTRSEIPFARAGDGRWGAQLRGERKLTIPLGLAVVGDRLEIESFFMRRPQENADRFYALLLRRNMRSYGVSFAIDALGDVYLVGRRALAGLDEAELDRIVGAVLVESDGLFDAAIAIGFETYLASDMKWRETAARQAAATDPGGSDSD